MEYGTITIKELVDIVKSNKKLFPDGMNTKIYSGDFEGNDWHSKHAIQHTKLNGENMVFLGYEMHENCF
jgi:hypothetical protein